MLLCRHLHAGRLLILLIAVVGVLPLLADPTALDATTVSQSPLTCCQCIKPAQQLFSVQDRLPPMLQVSGTIVLGLGPPVFALMFVKGYKPLVFHIPFWW